MQARDYVRPQYPCIAPLRRGHPLFFIWADALIGPEADGMGVSVFSDRSGDAPHGAMWASPPTLKTLLFCHGDRILLSDDAF